MKLFHFSNIDVQILIVSPEYFGKHSYSKNDAKINIPRSFWYLNPNSFLIFVFGDNLYSTIVPDDLIFDFRNNEKLNELKQNVLKNSINDNIVTIDELLNEIKKQGFNCL